MAVHGRVQGYRDRPGLCKPVTAMYLDPPGTLDTGYLPVYCTKGTLHLGTLSHLDSCTGLWPVLLVHALTMYGEVQGSPTYQGVPGRPYQALYMALPGLYIAFRTLYMASWPYIWPSGPYILASWPYIWLPGPYILASWPYIWPPGPYIWSMALYMASRTLYMVLGPCIWPPGPYI